MGICSIIPCQERCTERHVIPDSWPFVAKVDEGGSEDTVRGGLLLTIMSFSGSLEQLGSALEYVQPKLASHTRLVDYAIMLSLAVLGCPWLSLAGLGWSWKVLGLFVSHAPGSAANFATCLGEPLTLPRGY